MVSDPKFYAEKFIESGADIITFHYEACNNPKELISYLRKTFPDIKIGISIKPKTDVNAIIDLIELVDLVLVMSVEPGFGGQKFMPMAIEKIKTIPGIRIYGDFDMLPDKGLHCAIVSVNIADMDSAEVSDILMNEYGIATRSGIHCAPLMHKFFGTQNQGMVRFSFSYYNTVDEINEAAEALMQIAGMR